MQEFTNPLLALHDVTIGLLGQDNPDILLDTILDQAIEFTEADSGSIALLNENRTHLEIKVFRGLSQDIPEKVKLKLGEGVTGRCILTGKLKNVGNTKGEIAPAIAKNSQINQVPPFDYRGNLPYWFFHFIS